jgi:ribosomal protein S18 acetylase RimI-like enzyme
VTLRRASGRSYIRFMDTRSLHIRPAGPDDLPALLDLYTHLTTGDAPVSGERAVEVFEQFLAYRGSAIFVAETEGLIAASCTLVVVPNLTRGGSPYGLIENVVTHPDYRKRGFGRQVLDAASDAAWQAGCYKVMLMTGSKKPETIRFYLGAGFEQSKTGFQKRRIPHRAEA